MQLHLHNKVMQFFLKIAMQLVFHMKKLCSIKVIMQYSIKISMQ